MRRSFSICLMVLFCLGCSEAASLKGEEIQPLVNREYIRVLQEQINKARQEIIISSFLFKTSSSPKSYTHRIQASLRSAADRGVRIRVLLERSDRDEINRSNEKTARLLKDAGIEVFYDDPDKTTHIKLVIIDRSVVIMGSHNLTESALRYNNEASVLIRSRPLALYLLNYLKAIYPGAFKE